MTRPSKLRLQVSSGGVIYRNDGGNIEVALIATKGGDIWCLPKGIVDKGETSEDTAMREVKEETGLNGRLIDKIGEISYWYFMKEENARCKKTVHYYLMDYISGSTEDHDREVDKSRWFPIDEAIKLLAYKGDRETMEKAKNMILEMAVPPVIKGAI